MDEEEKTENTPTNYVIRLQGYLDSDWSEWFYGLAIAHQSDGTTTLSGPLIDQAVLHSVLGRIRDMNLTLIDLYQAGNPSADEHREPDENKTDAQADPDASSLKPENQDKLPNQDSRDLSDV